MADPIVDGLWRAQVVFQDDTGLPTNRFVNNFVFGNQPGLANVGDNHQEAHAIIATMLAAFYTGTAATARTIASYIPPFTTELRTYRFNQAPPREPRISNPFQDFTGWGTANSSIVREAAAVLSFTSAIRGPRGNGRIYLGPLTNQTMTFDNGKPVVNQTFIDTVIDRATDLMDSTENLTWMQFSPTLGGAAKVIGGWMDDAFDTQRSRGVPPKQRTLFGIQNQEQVDQLYLTWPPYPFEGALIDWVADQV